MLCFWLAVLAGALVLGVAFLRLPGISSPQITMLVVILAALGTGFFAARRGALAGFLIVYVANVIFVVVNLIQRGIPQGDGGTMGFAGRMLVVQVVLLQFAIPAAIAGWCGAYARRRWLRGRPAATHGA